MAPQPDVKKAFFLNVSMKSSGSTAPRALALVASAVSWSDLGERPEKRDE